MRETPPGGGEGEGGPPLRPGGLWLVRAATAPLYLPPEMDREAASSYVVATPDREAAGRWPELEALALAEAVSARAGSAWIAVRERERG